MRLLRSILPSLVVAGSIVVEAASSWSFDDATVSVSGKGAAGSGFKEKLNAKASLSGPVSLDPSSTLKIILTTTEDRKPKRPHQAFLLIQETESGLETAYPFSVKESGKGKVELSQKELPQQLLTAPSPLAATIVIGSFGTAVGHSSKVFDLELTHDPSTPLKPVDKPLRYGKLPEIHHIFRADPKSPPKIISLFFTLAVLASVPLLLGVWLVLSANISALPTALSSAPVAHILFLGSLLSLEGIFFLYYTSWNLFQTLPAAAVAGSIAFVSGSRALSEVQARRLKGEW